MKDIVINKNNPFSIPDLTPMLDAVEAFVKEHQGEKGFILTDNPENDTIWAICYDETQNSAWEPEVKAVRVNKHGVLQAVIDNSSVCYDEERVAKIPEETQDVCGFWLDVRYDDYLYFIPTIFNIAENIEEYVED